MFSTIAAGAVLLGVFATTQAAVSPSVWVYPSATGNLLYGADTNGVRINDFSDCGYKRGEAALPDLSRLVEQNRWFGVDAGVGDDTARIQAMLDWVGLLLPNSNDFRGVVLLQAEEYQLSNTVRITRSGVVLKGAGSSLTSGTRLRATFAREGDLVSIENYAVPVEIEGSRRRFTEPLVPAGTRTFRVNGSAGYQPGDAVIIRRDATPAWLHATDMDQLNNDPGLERDWIAPYAPTGEYERRVTHVEGDWITVDAPVPQTFEARYGGGTIWRVNTGGRLENVGVEDLACTYGVEQLICNGFICRYNGWTTDDTRHPTAAVAVRGAMDTWVRNVTAQGYFSSCAFIGGHSRFVTVAECQMLNPADSANHNRYAFLLETPASHVLVRDCYSENSRHDYILGNQVPGPNAFVRCRTSESDDDTGPHQRWATGALFDNVSVDGSGSWNQTDGQLNVQNRGRSGGGSTSHGWVGTYMVVWNCWADDGFRVRNPPTARNWLIGSEGAIRSSLRGCWYDDFWWDGDCWAVGADPEGTYDQSGDDAPGVRMRSLYYAQRQQRLKWPDSRFREYRLGDIDQLAWTPPANAGIPLDTNWQAQVSSAFPGQPVRSSFDEGGVNVWRAFTFDYPLAAGERVVAASLTLGLRFIGGGQATPGNELLFLDDLFPIRTFASLGWNAAAQDTSAHTLEVPVNLLQDGRLNVALGAHTMVDFATLYLQTTSTITSDNTRTSAADTYVQGGGSANQNFGSEPELVVKNDSDGRFDRKSLVKWDLGGFTGQLANARVRLYCTTVGQAGNEQMASVIRNDGWAETGITWNQFAPWPVDKPIAYWVPVAGQFVEFTVTPEVADALAGDRAFSLSLDAVQDWGDAGGVHYASREHPDPALRPQLFLRARNYAPTITAPPNQTMYENSTLGPLPITIGDAETPAASLGFTVTSSHPTLFKGANLIVGGSGANRTVTLRALAGQVGSATLTVNVSDGAQTASASFTIFVWFTNSPPRITAIPDQTMEQATAHYVTFSVSDRANLLNRLQITARASNPTLFPPGSMEILAPDGLGGPISGSRTLRLAPALERSGSAVITVAVSDTEYTTTEAFTVTVTPVGELPEEFAIISPRDGDVLHARTPLRITAYLPPEPVFGRLPPPVTFLAEKKELGTVLAPPYSLVWSNPPPGQFALVAYTTNRSGLVTSAPVNVIFTTNAPPGPRLLSVFSRSKLTLIWPETTQDFLLESTPGLGANAEWRTVDGTPQAGEGFWFVVPPPTGEYRFFRLKEGRTQTLE